MADGSKGEAKELSKDAVVGVLQGALQVLRRHIGDGSMSRVQVEFARRQLDEALLLSVGHGLIARARDPWEVP